MTQPIFRVFSFFLDCYYVTRSYPSSKFTKVISHEASTQNLMLGETFLIAAHHNRSLQKVVRGPRALVPVFVSRGRIKLRTERMEEVRWKRLNALVAIPTI
jgi:hypothetical protein